MSDGLQELKDALNISAEDWLSDHEVTIMEAAIRVVNGKRIRWCTQHQSPAGSESEECLVKDEWGGRHDCVIVNATIVTDP